MAWRKNWIACLLAASSVMIVGRLALAGDINVTYSESKGSTTTYTYDSQSSASQSSSGNVTTYTYDSNSQTGYGAPATTYSYDANDQGSADSSTNPPSYTDSETLDGTTPSHYSYSESAGSTTTYSYSYNDAPGGVTIYTYDHANEQVSQADPNGRTTQYQYDSANGVTDLDTSGQGNTTRYKYDAQDRTIQNIDDTTTSSQNAYDDIDKTIEFTDGFSISTQYDFEGGIIIQSGDVRIEGLSITLYDESTSQSLFDFSFPTFTPPGSIPGMSPTSTPLGSLQGWLTPGDTYTYSFSYQVVAGASGNFGTVQSDFDLHLVPLPASAWMGILLLSAIGVFRHVRCRNGLPVS